MTDLHPIRAMLVALALLATACSGATGIPPSTSTSVAATAPDTTSPPGGGSDFGEPPATTTTTTMPTTGTEVVTVEPAYCDGAVAADLVWVHEQEPPDLHLLDPRNNRPITARIWQALWEDLYGTAADMTFYPELLDGEAEVTERPDGTVTIAYRLREGLVWSDGVPLTSEDVRFTYDVLVEGVDPVSGSGGVLSVGNRARYRRIAAFTVISDTEFEVTLSTFVPGWRSLFTNVMPAHAFGEGAGAAEVEEALRTWRNAGGVELPSSGPMVFESWERGIGMRLVRNGLYHGSTSPDAVNPGAACVTGVQIDFVSDTAAQLEAMQAGRAHIMMTKPEPAMARLTRAPRFAVASQPGSTWEHWGLNVLNPHLARPQVREAIALALDKGAVVEEVYGPLFEDLLPVEGLGNTYWMTNQPHYEDHQADYAGAQIDEARGRLEAAGYVLGGDGVYTHPVDGRLTLRAGTTGGDELRERQQRLIAEQLEAAGFDIVIDNVAGGEYFVARPYSADALLASATGGAAGDPTVWDITEFGWVGGAWPGVQSRSYRSGSVSESEGETSASTNNPYGFSNEAFDQRSTECDLTVDDEARAACYNELDQWATTLGPAGDGLFMLPITQKPDLYIYDATVLAVVGVAPDVNQGGPLVNVVDFVLQ